MDAKETTNSAISETSAKTGGGDNLGTYISYSIPANLQSTTTRVQVDVTIQQLGNMPGKLIFPAIQVDLGPDAALGEVAWKRAGSSVKCI
ncbi:hypothetical protein QEG73_22810 [Chitinophagaceae bacterium 26-R-25]|nr:hypothetical protein [Chitinophagaceae bacterium 26-R-25]